VRRTHAHVARSRIERFARRHIVEIVIVSEVGCRAALPIVKLLRVSLPRISAAAQSPVRCTVHCLSYFRAVKSCNLRNLCKLV